jgi:hypothetical protein
MPSGPLFGLGICRMSLQSSSWLGMSPTCWRHVSPTTKCCHFWPTQPCRADTKLIPTQHFCVGDGQRLPLSSFSTRGMYAQPAKNLYIHSRTCLLYNRCSKKVFFVLTNTSTHNNQHEPMPPYPPLALALHCHQ